MDLPEESLINRLKVNVLHSIIGSGGQICYQLIGFLKHIDLSDLAQRWMVLKQEDFRQAWKSLSLILVSEKLFLTHLNALKRFGICCSWQQVGYISYILTRGIKPGLTS